MRSCVICHKNIRRLRHHVVVEDRSVAPVWPRWMATRHRSAGGRWWSWRSWSIQRLRGRPELRTQSRSGRLPTDASTCSLSAWWAGMLGDILATCPQPILDRPNVDHTRPSSSDQPDISRESRFFIHNLYSTPALIFADAMHKRWLCRHAVSVCVSVCPCVRVSVTFVSCVKTNKDIFKIFSPSGSKAILVFPYQTGWRYSDVNPPNGGVECRWSRQKSRFWAYMPATGAVM